MIPAELDSHADTCCMGYGCKVLSRHPQTVSVEPFDSSLGQLQNIAIVDAAVAFDHPETKQTWILVFRQVLYIPKLECHLLCPMQMRLHGITVNDVPSFIHTRPDDPKPHCIFDPVSELTIPLRLRGVISYFPCRVPTADELSNCYTIYMTADTPEWDPHSSSYTQMEENTNHHVYQYPIDQDNPNYYHAMDAMRTFVSAIETEARHVAGTNTKKRKGFVSAKELAKRWNIGLREAERTIEHTTQRAVHDFTHTQLGHRLLPSASQLRYRHLNTWFYIDIMYATNESILSNKYGLVIVSPFRWSRFIPLTSRKQAWEGLKLTFSRNGVPTRVIADLAGELFDSKEMKLLCSQSGTYLTAVEKDVHEHNLAENEIRELKRIFRRTMRAKRVPPRLWDHCFEWCSLIRSATAHPLFRNRGEVPETIISGETLDISCLAEFPFYDWVWFLDPPDWTMETKHLGRYLGPSFDVGSHMCHKVLKDTGKVRNRTSVIPVTAEELRDETIKKMMADFDESVSVKLGSKGKNDKVLLDDDANAKVEEPIVVETVEEEEPNVEPYEDDQTPPMERREDDDYDHEAFDKLIDAEVILPTNEGPQRGRVRRRKRDSAGNPIGHAHDDTVLDTRVYEVEFPDGSTSAYTANLITEHIFSQVDEEGRQFQVMSEIVDHRKNHRAVTHADKFVIKNGRSVLRRTTVGWDLCIRWKDGTSSWHPLSELKESNPVLVAEYAVTADIAQEPAFAWWVPHILRKRDRIIKAVKNRVVWHTHKYGVEVPRTVEHAIEIDRQNGNTVWQDAIRTEMKTVDDCFEYLPHGQPLPPGYLEIGCHLIFDVKMDLTRKARFVANGNETDTPAALTYCSNVQRESIRLGFLLAHLNDLDVLTADIQGAYLHGKCVEKIGFRCGIEFGNERHECFAIIVKGLYGLRSAGATWHRTFAAVMDDMGFEACKADRDVWMRAATKADGTEYYEYILVYTDDLLAISENPRKLLETIGEAYPLKKGSIVKPTILVGATIEEFSIPGEPRPCWAMGSQQYLKEAIRNVEKWLSERDSQLKTKAQGPLPSNYSPELDVSPELDASDASYYASTIGVLRWIVELGRIDVCAEVSMLAGFIANPREGHLDAMMHLFAYLKTHDRSRLVMDSSIPELMETKANTEHWKDFYGDVSEPISPNMPAPRGKPVVITMFCDANHANNKVNRRSRSGILIFVNRSPVSWYSKLQATVETSTFGSEFVALKLGVEMLRSLRYKLRMMGVPFDGPSQVICDNMSVVNNTTRPESTLNKKSLSIAYHYVRESVAMDILEVYYCKSGNNLADILTKSHPGPVRQRLAQQILF